MMFAKVRKANFMANDVGYTNDERRASAPNDVCLAAHWANIASLRNAVEQHHFERIEKHHIAVGDASVVLSMM